MEGDLGGVGRCVEDDVVSAGGRAGHPPTLRLATLDLDLCSRFSTLGSPPSTPRSLLRRKCDFAPSLFQADNQG